MKINADIKTLIRKSNLSYSQIIQLLIQNYGIKISKSTVSYYKRSQKRLKEVRFQNIKENEVEWLKGLFLADGCKFIEKNYSYVVKIALDRYRDGKIIGKLARIFERLHIHYNKNYQGNAIIFRVLNKTLFANLPETNALYESRDNLAFLAGLIDGDGCKHGTGAILVQAKNEAMMNCLVRELNITKHSKVVQTNFGRFKRTQYYIPKKICSLIRSENLSEKLS